MKNKTRVSPTNGRHFKLDPENPHGTTVEYHLKNLLTTPGKDSNDYPCLAWVTVDGYSTCVQGIYKGSGIFRPSPSDDFYFDHLKEFLALKHHIDQPTIQDSINLIKKYGDKKANIR